uniref:EF-hand domain-containing protein n=1 Tax=Salarias fasciatus TaxID=181472 RepID=A0A672I4P8_SALFA
MSGITRKVIKTLTETFQNKQTNKPEPTNSDRGVQGLDRAKFRNSTLLKNFGMADDLIMDRGLKNRDCKFSLHSLAVFLRGTLDEDFNFTYCSHVYDSNGDGYISREEMFRMLKSSLIRQPTEEDPDDGIKDLVEMTLKKMVGCLFVCLLARVALVEVVGPQVRRICQNISSS